MSLLEVTDLRVSFSTEDGILKAVQGMTFSVDRGETLGIVGESGSGKSVSTQTVMGLTSGAEVSGQALFDGQDLLTMTEEQLRAIRGSKVSMIFQDPLTSLHPLYRVGRQIEEVIRTHRKVSRKQAAERSVELLTMVGIPNPARRVRDYPHQFSGGMRQRAMIAIALALEPALLIADEPTTALDVTVQAQILELIERMQEEHGTAVIMITHDLGVVAEMADKVVVMYAGRPVEVADTRTIFTEPHHPYTKGLLASIPAYSASIGKLLPISGSPPSLLRLPPGCPFAPRCPEVMDACRKAVPPLEPAGFVQGHLSACIRSREAVGVPGATDVRESA